MEDWSCALENTPHPKALGTPTNIPTKCGKYDRENARIQTFPVDFNSSQETILCDRDTTGSTTDLELPQDTMYTMN